jgi:DNA-binding GntR family transcriptional regulator
METTTPSNTQGNRSRRVKRNQGFVDEIVQLIRADIMSLRIPPDTRILIDSLSKQLGVSQTPVREALSRLEATGLVVKQHFIGYCSAPQLNRQQLEELYELRLVLEPYAARCAAERMSDEDLRVISALGKKMGSAETQSSYELFAAQDAELHDLIATGAGNALITEALSNLHTHLHIFRLRQHSEVPREAQAEHKALITALTHRKPSEAEAAMRAHIENSFRRQRLFVSN